MRLLVAKLPRVPRYRQRVRTTPLHLGRPAWVDDEHFEILYHVRHTAVPAPGGAEQLRNLAGRLFAQRLDLAKPLWEMWLVEGLEGGRWAVISKVHHCMIDGVAGWDLAALLLDTSPDAEHPPAIDHWTPRKAPSTPELVLGGLRGETARRADEREDQWERYLLHGETILVSASGPCPSGDPTKPPDVAISLPTIQLPCIDDLFPFGDEEPQTEFVPANFN